MFLKLLIEVVLWPEYIDNPWWSMVACKLKLWGPSTTLISISMEHISLLKLLFIYLNRLTTVFKYFGGCRILLDSTWQVFFLWGIVTNVYRMVAISQTTFSNAFSRMRSFVYWFEFHWSLFLRFPSTISQYWSRQWVGCKQATSHYLNQYLLSLRTHKRH